MEEIPDQLPTSEQIKQAFIKRLAQAFNNIRNATTTMEILNSVTDLNDFMHTKGFGFKGDETLFELVPQLDKETSPDARKQILLDTLANKDTCDLDEEILDLLRESVK